MRHQSEVHTQHRGKSVAVQEEATSVRQSGSVNFSVAENVETVYRLMGQCEKHSASVLCCSC